MTEDQALRLFGERHTPAEQRPISQLIAAISATVAIGVVDGHGDVPPGVWGQYEAAAEELDRRFPVSRIISPHTGKPVVLG